MATVVEKTIGTGGDYTTLQSWEDACPANLVTSDQVWRGLVKNQLFSIAGTALIISGTTTDSTRYIELTTEAGASFLDNANVQTNALRYNSSNGAAIEVTTSYTIGINSSVQYTRVSKLQIKISASSGAASVIYNNAVTNFTVDKCIIETNRENAIELYGSGVKVSNSLIVQRKASATSIASIKNTASAYNCTFVATGSCTTGLIGAYGAATIKNCYVGGVTNISSGTAPSTTTCYTSVSGPPSGWSAAAFSTSSGAYFQSITDGSHDFRIKTDSVLKDVGTTDSTNAAVDIAGTSRPSGSAYDVGCWEFVAAASAKAIAALRSAARFAHMMVR